MRKRPKKSQPSRKAEARECKASSPRKAMDESERRALWTRLYIQRGLTGLSLILAVALGFFVGKAGRDLDTYYFHLNWVQRLQAQLLAENEMARRTANQVITLFDGLQRCRCEGEAESLDLAYNQFLDLVEAQLKEKEQTQALLREFETQQALRNGEKPPADATKSTQTTRAGAR